MIRPKKLIRPQKPLKDILLDAKTATNNKRDDIAIKVMKVVASKLSVDNYNDIAKYSYKIADAMIKESKKYQ